MPLYMIIQRTQQYSNGLPACSLGKLMLCCPSTVGGLWWSLGQSLCRSRGCLTSGRFAASVMHLSSGAGRPHAHQRASSSAGAAAAAASTPACMSLPRACRGALASTSQAPTQTFQHNLPRRMHTCQVTALARSQTHLSAAVQQLRLLSLFPQPFPSYPHFAFTTCAGCSQHQQQHPGSSSVHLNSSA